MKDRGGRIRHAAQLRGLGKTLALAAELRVSAASISKWKNGGHISLESACGFANNLDISLDWLLLGRGAPDWHLDRSISEAEMNLLLLLRRRPERIKALVFRLLEEIPGEVSIP